MNAQLIMVGVVVLSVVLAFQVLRYSSAFQVLVAAFIFAWSALVAVHCWPLSAQIVATMRLPNLTDGQTALIAYWCTFIVAAVPAWLPKKFWLQSYSTTFSFLVDRLLHLACVGVMLVGIASLVVMSAALATADDEDGETEPAQDLLQWVSVTGRRIPLQAYLKLSDAVSSPEAAAARRERLPTAVRSALQ